jgi:hypothetical protein
MTSGTPINRPVQPRFGAGSGLQSPLGNDDLTNQWKKTKVPSSSTFGLATTVARLVSDVGKLRRRIVSPPGTGTAAPASTPNWNYRGLWSATPPSPYMTFDVVQLGSGTAAGMYLSTIDGNTNSPDTGTGWTQVSSSSGTWL